MGLGLGRGVVRAGREGRRGLDSAATGAAPIMALACACVIASSVVNRQCTWLSLHVISPPDPLARPLTSPSSSFLPSTPPPVARQADDAAR